LGKVPGVDGFKTGYTRASGFNLTASAERNNRRLIVVVMGGANRHWRDRRVTELFDKHFKKLPSVQQTFYEKTSEAEKTEDTFESKVIDDAIQNIVAENHQIKENIPITPTPVPTVAQATWVVPQAPVQVIKVKAKDTLKKKKPALPTTGIQVGAFGNKLQATLAAQRVAKFTGGTVNIKAVTKRKKKLFLAQVKGLTMAQARTVCKDLKGQQQECLPFSQTS
jgi:D-alanyl-D-alanine carboxypeptidase